jgi:hypothetical protein
LVPAILSAQLAGPGPIRGSASEGYTVHYRLYVVFSTALDPASLWPEKFVIMLLNGERVAPYRATLAPANEDDENRTVALELVARVTPPPDMIKETSSEGQRDSPPARERAKAWMSARAQTTPRSLALTRALHGESGVVIDELSSAIPPIDSPVRLTLAHRVPISRRRCPDFAQAIRTYWSTPVSSTDPIPGIWLRLGDGRRVHPDALDDHPQKNDARAEERGDPRFAVNALVAARGGERGDNVIDLCLREPLAATHLEISAGIFTGEGTQANAAIHGVAIGPLTPAPSSSRSEGD